MSIWHRGFSLEEVNRRGADTLYGHLGIEFIEAGDDYVKARMPVDRRTVQPAGVLHGGASAVLAETLASWAGAMAADPDQFHVVGLEINASHLRAARSGWVYGIAKPERLGRTVHVWSVHISDEQGKPVCVARVTLAVLPKPSEYV